MQDKRTGASSQPPERRPAPYEKPRITWREELEVRCQVSQSCTRVPGGDPQCDVNNGGTPST